MKKKRLKFIESEYYGPASIHYTFKLGEGEATTTFGDKRIVMKGTICCDFVISAKYGPQLQIKVISEKQPKIEKRSREDIKWSRTEIYLSPEKSKELSSKLGDMVLKDWFLKTLKEREIKP